MELRFGGIAGRALGMSGLSRPRDFLILVDFTCFSQLFKSLRSCCFFTVFIVFCYACCELKGASFMHEFEFCCWITLSFIVSHVFAERFMGLDSRRSCSKQSIIPLSRPP